MIFFAILEMRSFAIFGVMAIVAVGVTDELPNITVAGYFDANFHLHRITPARLSGTMLGTHQGLILLLLTTSLQNSWNLCNSSMENIRR
uniref:Secreted protein n=1 Tax=Panagrellus redivivus TaxID=6233 RepID=A0A7E4UY14_PANRE